MAGRVIPAAKVTLNSRMKSRQAIELTEAAGKRLHFLISKKQEPVAGIRLGVKKRGCNGLSYTLDYVSDKDKKLSDEVVQQHGVTVFIEPQALISVVGTKMDFVEDPMKAEFVFVNPNAKASCGCGESFTT
eukprot:TRINITY_DN2429_c0_g1_i1.p1 TRINITY_DN2429_c0_g1~~TRINITY_DN2429_c0_g1_i1.p1  ORF type:complete len:131 (-),score=10.00 TRINITY_DN2429_c0_g1_i1:10-402(-)